MIENEATRIARETYEFYAREEKKAADQRRLAYNLWMEERAAFAAKEGHELAGKTVSRQAERREGYTPWSRSTRRSWKVTETGIVTLATTDHARIRNHQPVPGEWFVLSKSGATGYKLTDDWKVVDG